MDLEADTDDIEDTKGKIVVEGMYWMNNLTAMKTIKWLSEPINQWMCRKSLKILTVKYQVQIARTKQILKCLD
jgi:hypothetical protein